MPKKEIYKQYKDTVNMTYSELLTWSKTECSKKASLNRSPIKRNLVLLKKPFKDWDIKDEINAKRTIGFIKRMIRVPQGNIVCNGLSKRDIALKNWAFNPKKNYSNFYFKF